MNNDAFENVLQDLRDLVREHPEYKSMLIRLLRAVRELFLDVAEQAGEK